MAVKSKKPTAVPPWAKTFLTPTFIDRVDMCPEGCNSEAFIKLIKHKEGGTVMEFDQILETMSPEAQEVVKAHIVKEKETAAAEAVKPVQEKLDETNNELEMEKKKNCKANVSKEDAIAKALETCDPIMKEIFLDMQAKQFAAEEAAKIAKEKQEEQIAKEKAAEFANLGVEQETLISVCKSLNGLGEVGVQVYNILKAANNVAEAEVETGSIFKAKGTTGQDNEPVLSGEAAWANIQKEAETIAKERSITKAQAVSAVIKEKPELYNTYLDAME